MAEDCVRGALRCVVVEHLCSSSASRTAVLQQYISLLEAAVTCSRKEGESRNPDAHVENFVEVTVPKYTPCQFKEHFRMDPTVFEALCEWIAPHLPPERTVSVHKKMLATLWLVANKESYRSVADRFGMNKGALHNLVMTVCRSLTSRVGDVIRWPTTTSDLKAIAQQFERRAGMPNVIGAIDGTYIQIPGPGDQTRDSYICRKGFAAMHLQVVSSADMRFLDVHTGHAGSVHDSRVFRTSDLRPFLEGEGKLPPEFHLIGDSAYPLKDYLLVPFRDNGYLDTIEKKFNYVQSSTRVIVEQAIGLLKGKFRRLKYLDMTKLSEAAIVIFACCILHNFIIIESGIDEDDIELDAENATDDICADSDGDERSADEKRTNIAYSLL